MFNFNFWLFFIFKFLIVLWNLIHGSSQEQVGYNDFK